MTNKALLIVTVLIATLFHVQAKKGMENDLVQDPKLDDLFGRRLHHSRTYDIKLKVTNLSFMQPFSAFFVMVHNSRAQLFEFGEQASDELALLAENGDAMPLKELFEDMNGVEEVMIHNEGAPYDGGESTTIEVTISRKYPFVTIAAMAINTNDLFVALNGVIPYPGTSEYSDGLDAGSEENNELCSSVPGPACADIDTTNVRSGNGEGFVHVHPGIHGIGNLTESVYDWRNPMMKVDFGY